KVGGHRKTVSASGTNAGGELRLPCRFLVRGGDKVSCLQRTVQTQPSAQGAQPARAEGEQAAGKAVREMFTAIAPRYDLLNHLLSFDIDRVWWRRSARAFSDILRRDDAAVLDLCCGTGDMTLALARARRGSQARITGADFSVAMLQLANKK